MKYQKSTKYILDASDTELTSVSSKSSTSGPDDQAQPLLGNPYIQDEIKQDKKKKSKWAKHDSPDMKKEYGFKGMLDYALPRMWNKGGTK